MSKPLLLLSLSLAFGGWPGLEALAAKKTGELTGPSYIASTSSGATLPGKNKKLAAPTGLTATPEIEAIALAWQSVEGATGYVVYWVEDPTNTPTTGGKKQVDPKKPSTRSLRTGSDLPAFFHDDLVPGWKYTYRVAASNPKGDGAASNEVAAVPQDREPMRLDDDAP